MMRRHPIHVHVRIPTPRELVRAVALELVDRWLVGV
jgi:hypothetical protein